jgi:pentose-5-phosphate-3-epimerase
MRVAVCLSGFPRTMFYSYPYLKKYILDELDPDIFFFGYSDNPNGIHAQEIIETYNPKLYKIREYTQEVQEEIINAYGGYDFKNVRLAKGSPIQILSQYYNMYNANALKSQYEKDNNFTYDMVMRLRTDYYFWRKVSDDELKIKDNEVYLPDIWNFGGVSSGFAFGKSDVMNKYSSLFNCMKKYNLQEGCVFHPETIKKYHLDSQGIDIKYVTNHYWWELQDFKTNNNDSSYIENLDTNPRRGIYQ